MKIIVCLRQFFSKKEIFLATPDDYSWGQGTVMMAKCAATLKLVGRRAGGGVDENIKITFKKLHSENITMGGQFFHLIMK